MPAHPARLAVAAVVIGLFVAGCELDMPTDSTVPSTPVLSEDSDFQAPDTSIGFVDPPAPNAGGSGLPDSSNSDEEIDCDNAEEMCDSGAFACDDIADYCDIGPDGGELSDDSEWDE